jgi:hypothetical protein
MCLTPRNILQAVEPVPSVPPSLTNTFLGHCSKCCNCFLTTWFALLANSVLRTVATNGRHDKMLLPPRLFNVSDHRNWVPAMPKQASAKSSPCSNRYQDWRRLFSRWLLVATDELMSSLLYSSLRRHRHRRPERPTRPGAPNPLGPVAGPRGETEIEAESETWVEPGEWYDGCCARREPRMHASHSFTIKVGSISHRV